MPPKTKTPDENFNASERKNADAWLNLTIPMKSKSTGKVIRRKLGGIPLDASNKLHARIIANCTDLTKEELKEVFLHWFNQEEATVELYIRDEESETDDYEI